MHSSVLFLFLSLSTGAKFESTKESMSLNKTKEAAPKVSLGTKKAKGPTIDLKSKQVVLDPLGARPVCKDNAVYINGVCYPIGDDSGTRCDGVLNPEKEWICKQAPIQCYCRVVDQCKCEESPVDSSGNRCIPCYFPHHLCLCYPSPSLRNLIPIN